MIQKAREFLQKLDTRYVVPEVTEDSKLDPHLVILSDNESFVAEQYKSLARKLLALSKDGKETRSVLITSSQPEEGKTTTACNLSASLAEDYELKTVLVDADLRRSGTPAIFGIERSPGLGELLSGQAQLSDIEPITKNLTVIPAGAFEGSVVNIVNSAEMSDLIRELEEKFDRVIVDAPPVLQVTDASILGAYCDAVLFVIRSGCTPARAVREAFEILEGTPAMPQAFIFTDAHHSPDYYSYVTNKHYRKYVQNKTGSYAYKQ